MENNSRNNLIDEKNQDKDSNDKLVYKKHIVGIIIIIIIIIII